MAGWNEWIPGTNMTLTEVLDALKSARVGLDVKDKLYWSFYKMMELAIKEGNANFDVAKAAGAFKDLASRLDASDNDLRNISVDWINKNLGKLDQTFMSDEFLQQIAGNSPVNAIPADNSLTTTKFVDKSVTTNKLAFWVNEHVSFGGGTYPNIYNIGSDIYIELKANTKMYTKPRTGGEDVVHTFPTSATTYRLASNEILLWNLDTNTVIQQSVSLTRPENSILLVFNHAGNANYGAITEFVPKKYDRRTRKGEMGFIDKTVNVDLSAKTIYFPSGTSVWYSGEKYLFANAQTFKYDATLPGYSAYFICFNVRTKSIESVSSAQQSLKEEHILLGWVDGGVTQKAYLNGNFTIDGKLPPYLRSLTPSKTFFITGLSPIIVNEEEVIFPRGTSIYVDNQRIQVTDVYTQLVVPVNRVDGFAFSVMFNPETKQIKTYHHSKLSLASPDEFLIGYIDYGSINGAFFNGDYVVSVKPKEKSITTHTSEGRAKIIQNFAADQGMTVIGEEIWVFRHSPDDHSDFGNIEVYDKDTFTHKGVISHNLGHAGGADYCKETDTLMQTASNMTNDGVIIQPEIMLVPNVSQKKVGGVIDYKTEAISVKLHETVDGVVTKRLGGTGIVWTFGESPHIAYGHSMLNDVNGSVMYDKCIFFKVLLGMGNRDFSDPTGQDTTRFGTFIQGKGNNEYNGTAKVLAKFLAPYLGINQGICYHDGFIYLALTATYNTAEIAVLKLMEDGNVKEVKRYRCPSVTKDGLAPMYEAEGCTILDGRYLLAGYRGHGLQQASLFPLYNEQGGKGVTGVRIDLPFPCNSIPQPQITPASPVADLYIETIDTSGFTVQSASGQTGSFIWSSRIS